jgi:CheY-like chemotaxis protein
MAKRILIVDDEKDLGELVDLMLRKAKLDVVCRRLTLGQDAMDACKKDPPNLLLLDVALPDIHGLEVLRLLKADPVTSHIPVVIITALRGQIVSEAAMAGAAGTLLKPFKRAELLQAVNTALQPMA